MKLNFTRGRNWSEEKPTTISSWNGIVVMLNSGEEGEVDIMFTGTSRTGNALFAKIVAGIKVQSKGFSTSGSMCCTTAAFTDEKGILQTFTPGLLNMHIHSADNINVNMGCVYKPSLAGIYYVDYYRGKLVAIGVDDPSLFSAFVADHNKQYKEFKETHTLIVGKKYVIKAYTGYEEATFIKPHNWDYGVFAWSDGKEFNTGIGQVRRDQF